MLINLMGENIVHNPSPYLCDQLSSYDFFYLIIIFIGLSTIIIYDYCRYMALNKHKHTSLKEGVNQ